MCVYSLNFGGEVKETLIAMLGYFLATLMLRVIWMKNAAPADAPYVSVAKISTEHIKCEISSRMFSADQLAFVSCALLLLLMSLPRVFFAAVKETSTTDCFSHFSCRDKRE